MTEPADIVKVQEEARSLLALASTDRRSAELAFEKLGFDRQLETALALSGDELHEWLMLAGDFTELVRSLPPEHLHQAVRLIGEEDALNLLQAASSEQMQQLTDIEWFTEGKLDHKKVRRWLELMMELDPDECDEALRGLDVNALAQYLKKRVRPAVDKDNLLLALHLNQRYLFTPDDLTTRDDFSRRLIEFLYNVDRDLFGEMLALLVAEEDEVVENDMYAGREDRLIQRGFPAQSEAEFLLEVVNASAYGIRWPDHAPAEVADARADLARQSRSRTPFLLHALAWGRSSGALGERTEREFIRESADLANSLLLAHSKDSGSPGIRAKSLVAVQVLASISLEALARGQLALATEQLKSTELRELFRLGWSLVREVARDAWLLAMDDRIAAARLQRNLKWLPQNLREDVLEAEDYMSWQRVAATAEETSTDSSEPQRPREILSWPRLCRLRWSVWKAQNLLENPSGANAAD